MQRLLTAIVLATGFGCGGLCAAGPFEPGKERDWDFLDQAKFRGTLVGMSEGMVQIRMEDGGIRDFWPGGSEAIPVTYLQRCVAKLPANPTRPNLRAAATPVIDLSAATLPAGLLRQWKNNGRAGGSFLAMNQPPKVADVQGRKCVVFEHAPWLLPLEFQPMVSDFYLPENVTSSGSLTLVAWLCNHGTVVDRETFCCWGEKDCGELDTPDFSYGCYDAMQWYDEKMVIPATRFPKFDQWHQFAYVISPSDKDPNRLRIDLFIDGTRATSKLVRKPKPQLLVNNLVFLGCAWEAWWGHSWETRPARPFTGAIAGLQVYDRALDLAEIRKLNGTAGTTPAPRPEPPIAATSPVPAEGARDVQTTLELVHWQPHPDAVAQVLHFGTDRDAVAKGTATKVKLKNQVEDAFLALELKLPKLVSGTTYYWWVEQIPEGGPPAPAAQPWSFTTSRFDLESDALVGEAFPSDVQQDGFYNRWMDAGGYPIISPPGNEDVHLRAARHALRKILGKRPDLVTALQSNQAATHLASQENRGWGWSQFTCSSYGAGEAVLREGAILLHETGHQFHMQGGEQMAPDFRDRLAAVFRSGRRERLWIGDYGGRNMWENVAVCSSWWVNDMTQDEGTLRPRELLRQSDPRIYHLLADYWPGDMMIELLPAAGARTDAQGGLLEWRNNSGIEYFQANTGWRFYQRTVGTFKPLAEKPVLRTLGGVSAMTFGGTSTLAWDQTTWDSLDGNRSWSVDAWVRRDTPAGSDEALLEWGKPGAPLAKLLWGGQDVSSQLPGGVSGKWTRQPELQRWHHVAWVFTGGGVADTTGELRVYLDGKLDHSTRAKLAIPAQANMTVARGYTGALAHLRIYNYDLHPLQLDALWKREAPAYQRQEPAVPGRLLVDLDPSLLVRPCDTETSPLYAASLNKPWLRSWTNLGTLAGKFHNDAHDPQQSSQPRAGVVRGAPAISFDGKSRMISSFGSPAPQAATVELWAMTDKPATDGILLQWGPLVVPSRVLKPGSWQHLAMTLDKGTTTIFVNGTQAATGRVTATPGAADRLILGAGGDGNTLSNGFIGHLAGLKVHDTVLSGAQIQSNLSLSPILRAMLPQPTNDTKVVASRKPALAWQSGAGIAAKQGDVYLGTRSEDVANAKPGSPCHLGRHVSGEFRPPLLPATRYFWRVDLPGSDGKVVAPGPLWSFQTAVGTVLDLDAGDLTTGPVRSWRNKGTAGGEFSPGSERKVWRPSVTVIDGIKAVDFSGRKSLVSSFVVPKLLTGTGSFTVSVWAYCPDMHVIDRDQAMLSWGRRPLDRAEFGFGSNEKNGAFSAGPKGEFGFAGPGKSPLPGGWRHLAYVYDSQAGKLRVFIDGKPNRQENIRLSIPTTDAICLGGVRTGKLPDSPFNGWLGEVAITSTALDDAQITRLAQAMPANKVTASWLVRLTTTDLPDGPLDTWRNQGTLGGTFEPEPETPGTPKAEQVAGRHAVTFDGQKGFLCSSIPTPPVLVGDQPFTVEMCLLNPTLGDIETVFSMAPSVAMKSFPNESVGAAAAFNFGSARDNGRDVRPGLFASGSQPRNVGWKEPSSVTPQWHHVAWVNSGGYRGTFKVYLDGKVIAERGFFTLDTIGGWPMFLGVSWNTARGASNPFSGSLSRLQVYDYIRTEQELSAPIQ